MEATQRRREELASQLAENGRKVSFDFGGAFGGGGGGAAGDKTHRIGQENIGSNLYRNKMLDRIGESSFRVHVHQSVKQPVPITHYACMADRQCLLLLFTKQFQLTSAEMAQPFPWHFEKRNER
ncbi:hypothetical protein GPALN_012853 [Globodera pallida]|nr:hypothetical protein GPALN_012853 [Globodera pallida]